MTGESAAHCREILEKWGDELVRTGRLPVLLLGLGEGRSAPMVCAAPGSNDLELYWLISVLADEILKRNGYWLNDE